MTKRKITGKASVVLRLHPQRGAFERNARMIVGDKVYKGENLESTDAATRAQIARELTMLLDEQRDAEAKRAADAEAARVAEATRAAEAESKLKRHRLGKPAGPKTLEIRRLVATYPTLKPKNLYAMRDKEIIPVMDTKEWNDAVSNARKKTPK